MKKIRSSKGFAHHIAVIAVVVVLAIGGIGSWIYLRSSSAATVPSAKSLCGGGSYGWWIVNGGLSVKGSNAILDYMGNSAGDQCAVVRSTAGYATQSKVLSVSIHLRHIKSSYNKVLKSNTGTVKSYLKAIHLTRAEARAVCSPLKYSDYYYFVAYASIKYNGNTKKILIPTDPGNTETPSCRSVR